MRDVLFFLVYRLFLLVVSRWLRANCRGGAGLINEGEIRKGPACAVGSRTEKGTGAR